MRNNNWKSLAFPGRVALNALKEWNNFAASCYTMRSALIAFLILPALAACKKDRETKAYPPSGGTWTLDGIQKAAQLSETTDRKGFQLSFSDRMGNDQISFLFRSRPQSATSFIAARDTSLGSNVAIHIESAASRYNAVNGVNGEVRVEIENGKLHLTGKQIRITPDSATNPETSLDFDLKEF